MRTARGRASRRPSARRCESSPRSSAAPWPRQPRDGPRRPSERVVDQARAARRRARTARPADLGVEDVGRRRARCDEHQRDQREQRRGQRRATPNGNGSRAPAVVARAWPAVARARAAAPARAARRGERERGTGRACIGWKLARGGRATPVSGAAPARGCRRRSGSSASAVALTPKAPRAPASAKTSAAWPAGVEVVDAREPVRRVPGDLEGSCVAQSRRRPTGTPDARRRPSSSPSSNALRDLRVCRRQRRRVAARSRRARRGRRAARSTALSRRAADAAEQLASTAPAADELRAPISVAEAFDAARGVASASARVAACRRRCARRAPLEVERLAHGDDRRQLAAAPA